MTERPAPSDGSLPGNFARRGPGADWVHDPVQRARYLDGECPPAEKAARDGDVARDTDARARVEREAAFLAALRRGASATPEAPELLEGRVRRALAADRAAGFPATGGGDVVSMEARRRSAKRSILVATLAVAAAVAIWLFRADVQPTDANAVDAAKAYRDALHGNVPGAHGGATCEEGKASPYRFPLVANQELQVQACVDGDGKDRSVSVLRTGGDDKLPRGLVSVAAVASDKAPVINVTSVDDAVVFDVTIGGRKYYLAAPRSLVDLPGGSCAACHGTSRVGKADPHHWSRRDR